MSSSSVSSSSSSTSYYFTTTPVEVRNLDTDSWYPDCSIIDADASKGTVLIQYTKKWRPDQWLSLQHVRPSAPALGRDSFHPMAGDMIEAMAKSEEAEPFSWWNAKVMTVKGGFYMITYVSMEDQINEILELDQIRPLNREAALRRDDIQKTTLPVPAELSYALQNAFNIADFEPIRANTGVLAIRFDFPAHPSKKYPITISVIGTALNVKRALMVIDLHLKHLTQLAQLKEKTKHHMEAVELIKQRVKDSVMIQFDINPELAGLVIGKKGQNIAKVQAMEGVQKIKVDQGRVTIIAATQEAADRARHQLEFIEEKYPIPAQDIGRIAGKKRAHLNDIQLKSAGARIRVGDRIAVFPETIELIISGNREAVADAKLLLDTHIRFLQQASLLTAEERNKAMELRRLVEETGRPDDLRQFGLDNGRGRGRGRGRGGRGGGRGRGGARASFDAAVSDHYEEVMEHKEELVDDEQKQGGEKRKKKIRPQKQHKNAENDNNAPVSDIAPSSSAAFEERKEQETENKPRKQQRYRTKKPAAADSSIAALDDNSETKANAPAEASSVDALDAINDGNNSSRGGRGRGRGRNRGRGRGGRGSLNANSSADFLNDAAAGLSSNDKKDDGIEKKEQIYRPKKMVQTQNQNGAKNDQGGADSSENAAKGKAKRRQRHEATDPTAPPASSSAIAVNNASASL